MKVLAYVGYFVLALAAALVALGQLGLLKGKAPTDIGIKDGLLKRPSKTPNSVSSQAKLHANHPQMDYAQIDPLVYTGDGEKAMAKVAAILGTMPRTTIVTQEADYLYAQCTTSILKFTDDVEFWLDRKAGMIQVRSASRLGRKDFNVNRARVEAIRAQFMSN
jgi:uncharacterized protein (DUF1499 family)